MIQRIKQAIRCLMGRNITTTVVETKIPIEHIVPSDKLLKGKVAVIGGAYGGIGKAIASAFYDAGCQLILAGRNISKLNDLQKNFSSEKVKILKLDYSDIGSFGKFFNDAFEIFGKVDIFVSAAGTHTENVDFWKMTPEEFDRVLQIDLKSNYFLCQHLVNKMISNHIEGHILLISSTRGSEPAFSPYGISKWGLNGMVKGLAQIYSQYGISVTCISPGPTATELIGKKEGDSVDTTENHFGRLTMPVEVANLALLTVSDAGTMLAGENIHLGGGRGSFDIR